MTIIIDTRVSYTAQYKRPRDRNFHPAPLNAIEPIVLREVSASEAPVAYRISSGIALLESFEVRLIDGSLYWPLHGNHGPMRSQEFVDLAKTDWEGASAVLDPLGRTYRFFGETFERHFGADLPKEWHSDLDDQLRQVRRDAARLTSIDGILHVDAGAPVWFAVFNKETRNTFDLVIGPASLDRKDRRGCHMPCVDRGTRLTSARLGRAFGLDELQEGLARLGADEVHSVSEVVPAGIHEAGLAAEVCATAWAQYLWEVAWRYPDLKRLIPAVANAGQNLPPPDELPHAEMLGTFVALEGTEAARALPPAFAEAHLLLERLAKAAYVACDEHEEALSQLGDLVSGHPDPGRTADRNRDDGAASPMMPKTTEPSERRATDGEKQVLVKVTLPFVQTTRRHRCKPRDVWLWKDHHVAIRVIDPDKAPVAFRIVPTARRTEREREYVVRNFDDRFWWPVLHWDDVPVSRATFVRRVGWSCDSEFLSLLDCAAPSKESPEEAKEYFDRVMVKEVLGSTLDEMQLRADRRANELAFCGGVLLASAGPPLWYGVDLTISKIIEVGPSSCLPYPRGNIKLPGPAVHTRKEVAAAGQVRDIRESDTSGHLLLDAGELWQTIEVLRAEVPAIAADFCAREFARTLPGKANFWACRDLLRAHVPTLAEALDKRGLGFDPPYRRLLEELVRGGRSVTPFEDDTIDLASDILNRMEKAGGPLSDDENDAVSSLAFIDQHDRGAER